MRRRHLFAAPLLFACATAAACAIDLIGTGTGSTVPSEAGPSDGPSPIDAPAPSDGGADAPGDSPANGDADATSPCPPGMVPAGASCVDRTEVTNADYARFLAALDGGLPDVLIPPVCGWNVSLVPSGAWPNDAGSLPVRFVDWCDAFTYCRARGKRLCGRPDGGPGDYNETLASGSEWLAACQGGAGRAFPYGTAYVAGACNDLSFDAGAPAPVGSLPGCEGGFAGVMDMAGNVGEWENACTAGGDPRLNGCRVRGGSYQTTSAGCASPGAADRALSYAHVGFRCCAP